MSIDGSSKVGGSDWSRPDGCNSLQSTAALQSELPCVHNRVWCKGLKICFDWCAKTLKATALEAGVC